MKKTLLLAITLLLVMGVVMGLAGCKPKDETPDEPAKSYTLDSTAFKTEAVFGENLSLSGLKLVEASGNEVVVVTKDMVSGNDTSSAGAKKLTISYNDQTFTVDYTVKFRVTFTVNGEVTTQYVLSASEIKIPELPVIPGKQFEFWSNEIPTTLTANLNIEAVYKTLSTERENAYTWTGSGLINLAGYAPQGSTVNVSVTDESGAALPSSVATVDASTNKISYTLGDYETVIIAISGTNVMGKSWKVQKTAQPTLTIADGQEAVKIVLGGNRSSQKINSTSSPIKFRYVATPNNANVNSAASNGYLFVDALKAGVTEITVKAINETNELEFITLKQYAVITPQTFTITNNATEYGIEDIWTIGRENANKLPKLTVSGGNADNIGDGFFSNVSWTCANENVTVSGGAITLKNVSEDPDVVEIVAVFGYKGVTIQSAPMKVRCVYNGYNVYNYEELHTETLKADPRPIVLQANIKDDFSATNYTWMNSTYDLTYYQNIGSSDTKIKVLMQFKNNVYGNGFEINAHNATIGTLDATGMPTDKSLFKGPLNFVAMAQTGGAISVKGQDNIVFAVYENVTLNNVVLKSCDLTATDGKVDLTELDYAGTTVEVLGDNVTIEYSRLMNGRTVLRVFGDDNDAEQKIHLLVKNTMLKGSREFIARIGSNRFEFSETEASPLLPGDKGSDYNAKKSYNSKTDAQKAEYDEKYINTFVTFENCVFEDAGIFSIGLDAHFAGEALRDGSKWFSGALVGWKNLAKTSYGAKIILEKDVRLYSWKPIDDIDSSTLMENTLSKGGNSDSTFANMEFNVRTLVKSAAKSTPAYANILYNYQGVDYVHAGIAFFGGGKNYSVVENKITDFGYSFNEYNVKLSELTDDKGQNQGYLQTAAGNEPFYFLIYDKTCGFTYETQLNLANKYDCLYK